MHDSKSRCVCWICQLLILSAVLAEGPCADMVDVFVGGHGVNQNAGGHATGERLGVGGRTGAALWAISVGIFGADSPVGPFCWYSWDGQPCEPSVLVLLGRIALWVPSCCFSWTDNPSETFLLVIWGRTDLWDIYVRLLFGGPTTLGWKTFQVQKSVSLIRSKLMAHCLDGGAPRHPP